MTELVGSWDPGLNGGVAVVSKLPTPRGLVRYRVHFSNLVSTKPTVPMLERYRHAFKEVEYAMRSTGARRLVIENQERGQVGRSYAGGSNLTDGRVMVTVGIAMGVAFAYGYQLSEVDPRQAKIGLLGKGWGSAEKPVVLEGVKLVCEFDRGCKVVTHSADAIAFAIYELERS